jgi:glycogen synthase
LVGAQVPIVASTGGLVDTVQDGVNGFQIGRAFNINVWSPLLFHTEIITEIANHVINSRCFRSLSAMKEASREREMLQI